MSDLITMREALLQDIADCKRERDEARERERVAIKSWDEERRRAIRESERTIEARKHREQLNSLLQSHDECWEEIKAALGEPEKGDQASDLDRVLKAICERDEAREALRSCVECLKGWRSEFPEVPAPFTEDALWDASKLLEAAK